MGSIIKNKWLLAILLPFLVSCGNFENIEIGEPQNIKVRGFEENYLLIDIDLPINNPTVHFINVTELDVRVFLNDRYLGKLIIDERIRLKPKQSNTYKLPVKIRIANILSTAFIMMNLKKGQEAKIKFEGKVKARSLFFFKTIEISETQKVKL